MQIWLIISALIAGTILFTLGVSSFETMDRKRVKNALLSHGSLVDIGNGEKIFVVDEGDKDAERICLIGHGMTGTVFGMETLANKMVEHCRVIRFSRGIGGMNEGGDVPLNLQVEADRTKRMLMALGIDRPVYYIGYSMGGMFARSFANHYPEMVNGLVIMDSGTDMDVTFPQQVQEEWGLAYAKQLIEKDRWPYKGWDRLKAYLSFFRGMELDYKKLLTTDGELLTSEAKVGLKYFILLAQIDWKQNPQIPMLYMAGDYPNDSYMQKAYIYQQELVQRNEKGLHLIPEGMDHLDFVRSEEQEKISTYIVDWISVSLK